MQLKSSQNVPQLAGKARQRPVFLENQSSNFLSYKTKQDRFSAPVPQKKIDTFIEHNDATRSEPDAWPSGRNEAKPIELDRPCVEPPPHQKHRLLRS